MSKIGALQERALGNGQRGVEVGPRVYADLLVAKVAISLTYEAYDDIMHNNVLWAQWKKLHPGMSTAALEKLFVRKHAHRMLDSARTTLAGLLTTGIAEDLKSEIHEALIRDNGLRRGRGRRITA